MVSTLERRDRSIGKDATTLIKIKFNKPLKSSSNTQGFEATVVVFLVLL